MTCRNRPFWAPGQGSPCCRCCSCYDHFWFRLPSKLLVVPQWNLVCSFIMVIPRDVFKDFLKFWIFFDFCRFSKKTLRNFWTRTSLQLLDAPQWNLACSFIMLISRVILKGFWKFWIFFDFCRFSKKTLRNFWTRTSLQLLVVPACSFIMVLPRDVFQGFSFGIFFDFWH